MNCQELIDANPLRLISPPDGGMVPGRHLALVRAPAGTGKTAILVQIGLDKLLRGERVVHVGINEQLNNIKLWYSQLFVAQVRKMQLHDQVRLEDEIMGRRLLMTFMAENFTPSRLVQRLDALSRHAIPLPDCLVIDGHSCHEGQVPSTLAELQSYARQYNMTIWLSCLGLSAEAQAQADTVLELVVATEGPATLTVVKDDAGYVESGASLRLDPQTFTLYRP